MTGKEQNQNDAPSGITTRGDLKGDAPERSKDDKPVSMKGPAGTKVTVDPELADDVKDMGFS
jgi:hypothetical protein